MAFTFKPAACIERIADSLPEPGPFTKTSTSFSPKSSAFRAALSAAIPAANGVDFFEPLKPAVPVEAHVMVLPLRSVMVTMVLLNVASICAIPLVTVSRTFFFVLGFFFGGGNFYPFLSLYSYGLSRSFSCARVCFCSLASYRQSSSVSYASVRAYFA